MDYPVWDIAIGRGVLIGWVAITHVIVSHFAIGGGFLIAWTETLAWRRGDRSFRDLAKRSSFMLILVSTVFGAISGVGIWIVVGLISPAGISALIHTYVWAWAVEWVFFFVEIIAALVYFATWDKVRQSTHVVIGWIYFVSAYLSLVVINGIVTYMLTPGDWIETRAFWDGFLNPTYWPSLVLRTGICLLMATAFMVWTARQSEREDRPKLMRYLFGFLAIGVATSYAGYRWWENSLPEDVQALFLGASPAIEALAATRSFLLWSLVATLALGAAFLLAKPRFMGIVPAILLAAAAFGFFGGYERLREGARKPYLIHDYMFSNGLRVDQIEAINEEGLVAHSGWIDPLTGDNALVTGRQIFLAQCANCHTEDGYLPLRTLLPEDPDSILGILYILWEGGDYWTSLDEGARVDKRDLDYPYMPPFVGTEEEMEALATYLAEEVAVPVGDPGGES